VSLTRWVDLTSSCKLDLTGRENPVRGIHSPGFGALERCTPRSVICVGNEGGRRDREVSDFPECVISTCHTDVKSDAQSISSIYLARSNGFIA